MSKIVITILNPDVKADYLFDLIDEALSEEFEEDTDYEINLKD